MRTRAQRIPLQQAPAAVREEVHSRYPHTLHGGVIVSLLDGAMTNCLFAHGLVAVTAELTIRFLRPVGTNREATVRAWLQDSSPTLHRLAAELWQDGKLMARATGKFIEEWHAPAGAAVR